MCTNIDINIPKFLKIILIINILLLFTIPVVISRDNDTNLTESNVSSTIIVTEQLLKVSDERYVLVESQRLFDRSLNILNAIVTLIGILIALIATLGIFEYDKLRSIRHNFENDMTKIRNKTNEDIIDTVQKFKKSTDKFSNDLKKDIDAFHEYTEKLTKDNDDIHKSIVTYCNDMKEKVEKTQSKIDEITQESKKLDK